MKDIDRHHITLAKYNITDYNGAIKLYTPKLTSFLVYLHNFVISLFIRSCEMHMSEFSK